MPQTKKTPAGQAKPKRGDLIVDEYGKLACMSVTDGYVLARRPGCVPVVMSVKDWWNRVRSVTQAEAGKS